MRHFHAFIWDQDADYVILGSYSDDGFWIEHTRWMVPGTQLED